MDQPLAKTAREFRENPSFIRGIVETGLCSRGVATSNHYLRISSKAFLKQAIMLDDKLKLIGLEDQDLELIFVNRTC